MPTKQPNNLEDFDAILVEAGDKLVVVDFTAIWCGPCQMITPVFEEFSEKYSNVVFVKVDVDEASDVCEYYEIRALPTVVFLKNRERLHYFKGSNTKALEEGLKKWSG